MLRAAHDLLGYAFDGQVQSSLVRVTAPVGPAQPDFLNAAVLVRSDALPEELLSIAMRIEEKLGRERSVRWGPRTIDVDVLWVEGETYATEVLSLPHVRLRERAFALAPLLDVCPDAVDPTDGTPYRVVYDGLVQPSIEGPYALGDGFATDDVMDHTAGKGFVVRALDRADLLAAAAEALANIMVHRSSVWPVRVLPVTVESASSHGFANDEERMLAFLREVRNLLDVKRFAARRVCVLEDGERVVKALLLGEPLDETRHQVRSEVKAIACHEVTIGPCERGAHGERLSARVIVDVSEKG